MPKSANNRTLVIEDSEREELRNQIYTKEDVKKFLLLEDFKDVVINADLFDVIDEIPHKFYDLVIIDPPYNLSKNFAGNKFNAMKEDDYVEYLKSWFPKVVSKMKDNASLYMCGDWKCISEMKEVVSQYLTVMNRITWQREKGRGASKNWKNGMEDILFAVKNPKDYYFDVESVKMKRRVLAPYKVDGVAKDWDDSDEGKFRMTYPSNFWDDITVPFWSMPENTDHPTQKPEKLIAKLILASSKKDGLILDPFLGSGTTAVVAKKLGRRFTGVEQSEEYCLYSQKRLNMAETDKTIQGYADGVFWERNSGVQKK